MWRNGCPHGNRDERVPLTRGHLSIAGEVTAPPTALDRAKRHPEMVLPSHSRRALGPQRVAGLSSGLTDPTMSGKSGASPANH